MAKIKQKFNYGAAVLGLVLFAVGVLFIVFTNAVTVLTVTLSIITLVLGIGFGSFQLARIEKTLSFTLKISAAIAAIVCGTVTLILRDSAASVVAEVFCLLLIIDGSFKLHESVNAIRYKLFGWWFLTVLSLFVIIVAYIMAKQSFDFADSETSKLPLLLGVTICADGVANVFAPIYEAVRRKKQTQIIIDAVAGQTADTATEQIEAAPAEQTAETAEETAQEQVAEQTEPTNAEQSAEQAGDTPAEQSENTPAEENVEQATEGEAAPAEQTAETVEETAQEQVAEQTEPTDTEQSAEQAGDTPAEQSTEQAGDTPTEQSENTPAEENAEQATEGEATPAEQTEKPAEA